MLSHAFAVPYSEFHAIGDTVVVYLIFVYGLGDGIAEPICFADDLPAADFVSVCISQSDRVALTVPDSVVVGYTVPVGIPDTHSDG